jgi:hypothetical protein
MTGKKVPAFLRVSFRFFLLVVPESVWFVPSIRDVEQVAAFTAFCGLCGVGKCRKRQALSEFSVRVLGILFSRFESLATGNTPTLYMCLHCAWWPQQQ